MIEGQDNGRAESARRHDDRALIEEAERAPSASGSSGGASARDVGARDEEERAFHPDADVTRVTGKDKVQPRIPTHADNEGAQS